MDWNTSQQDDEDQALYIIEKLRSSSAEVMHVKVPTKLHSERLPSGQRGFSISFMRAVLRFYRSNKAHKLDMSAICKKRGLTMNICELTRSTGLSLVESCVMIAEREGLDTSRLFAKATTYFSYASQSSLADVAAAVERSVNRLHADETEQFVWMDVLCASQNLLNGRYEDTDNYPRGTEGYAARKEDMDHLFDNAMKECSSIICHLAPLIDEWRVPPQQPYLRADFGDPPSHWNRKGPRAMSRAWCIYELASMAKRGVRVIVELEPDDEKYLQQLIRSAVGVVASMISAIDVNDSQLSNATDRNFLAGRIKAAGGYGEVNKLVVATLRDWLIGAMREALAAEEDKEDLGAEDLDMMDGLGDLLMERGQLEEAETMYRRALMFRIAEYGDDHPNTLFSVNNLAILLTERGKLDEAEPLYRRALAGYDARLKNSKHANTMGVCNNLAGLLYTKGRLDEAESLFRRALEGRDVTLGKKHPDTLATAESLAILLKKQNKHDEVVPLYRRALKVKETTLGMTHPNTLNVVLNLAMLFEKLVLYNEAEKHYRRALEGYETTLGKTHPSTLMSLKSLATLLRNTRKYEDAEHLYLRDLETKETKFGVTHNETMKSVNNLGVVLYNQAKYHEAEPYLRRALEGREAALGLSHPDTLKSVSNLAGLFANQSRYAEAEPLYRRAFKRGETALGADHPSTLESLNNLALLLMNQGKLDEAETLYKRAIMGNEVAHGAAHPNTLASVINLALLLKQQGRHREAEKLRKMCLTVEGAKMFDKIAPPRMGPTVSESINGSAKSGEYYYDTSQRYDNNDEYCDYYGGAYSVDIEI